MREIVRMKFGSHLFGTSTPASDVDYKAVHVPDGRSILLGRVKAVYTQNTKTSTAERNTAGDIDSESYALQKFLALAAEGQTVAMDMLFATPSVWLSEPSYIWHEIRENKDKLITSRAASFVGYCRTQANKYGIKGSRMATARAIVELLEHSLRNGGTTHKLSAMYTVLDAFAKTHEHAAMYEIEQHPEKDGPCHMIMHLEICNRKCPLTFTIKKAHEIYSGLFNEYGKRALAAETNQGIDWKALSHAVRVARECVELLTTGNITFPRPERQRLLDIKTGKLDYSEVAEEIEMLLPMAEEASANSKLRPTPDYEWIDNFVETIYGDEVHHYRAGW